jgi:hypothetical protein
VADSTIQAVTAPDTQAVTGSTTATIPATTTVTTQAAEDVAQLPAWAQTLVTELRKENASHRKAKSDADKAAQAAADAAALKSGEYQKLYEAAKPAAERAGALETFIGELLEAELKAVPDKLKPLVPEFNDPLQKLRWVQEAKKAGVLVGVQPVDTDAGRAQGTGAQTQAAKVAGKNDLIARKRATGAYSGL